MTVKGEHIVSLNEMKLNSGDKVLFRVDPGKYGRNLHIEFSRNIVLSVPALQHRVPVFRFILCLLWPPMVDQSPIRGHNRHSCAKNHLMLIRVNTDGVRKLRT